jgi:uncharacterized membrane protein YphA (DoxX/SURF4 family)
MDPGMEPVLSWTLRAALALLMAVAAVHKAADLPAFTETVRDYRLLPPGAAQLITPLIVLVEVGIGVGLLLPGVAPLAAPACGGLLLVYSAAIAANLARGRRHIDCGCLGPQAQAGARQPISGWLLARNGVLIAASLFAAMPANGRALLWVDAISIGGGLLVLTLLLQSTNILTAQAPGWSRLRRPS